MPNKIKKADQEDNDDEELSENTKKRIDQLPEHAQHIFKKAHAGAIKEYQNPEKRRGGKDESDEEVAQKVAWSAVKREYKKEGDNGLKSETTKQTSFRIWIKLCNNWIMITVSFKRQGK